jgi:rubredoxin
MQKEIQIMSVYACELCGYEYHPRHGDPESGVAEGTDFEDLPADWVCPLCGASKEDFEMVSGTDESNEV